MEQHNIPLNRGIHLTPSVGEDGQLIECVNLMPKNGSLRNTPQLAPVTQIDPTTQEPSQIELATGHTLAFIHTTSTYKHYITKADLEVEEGGVTVTKTALFYHQNPTFPIPILAINQDVEIYQITSVGNTIIVLTSDAMHYLLWKKIDSYYNYKYLGTHMPEMLVEFSLTDQSDATKHRKNIDTKFDKSTLIHTDNREQPTDTPTKAHNTIAFKKDDQRDYQKDFNDAIYGEVNKLMNEEATEKGYFANPFYVRYAYRLYDKSLIMHSAPIFMEKGFEISVKSEEENAVSYLERWDYYQGSGTEFDIHIVHHIEDEATGDSPELDLDLYWDFKVKRFSLNYQIASSQEITDLQEWSDIIKSVDIFISQPFYLYDQAGKIERVNHDISEDTTEHKQWITVDMPKVEHQEELINDCGQFYLVKSVDVNKMDTSVHDINTKGYLEALVARERMTDDYDSHDTLIPQYAFSYNQRINIANITKALFEGFNANAFSFPPGSDKLRMSVTYHTSQKDISFRLDEVDNVSIPSIWHYYIPSQYPVTLNIVAEYESVVYKQQVETTFHQSLNGYYAAILKSEFTATESLNFDTEVARNLVPTSDDITVYLPNKIYTSEVNNPFYFPASGINTVGTGEIKGICSAVKALSQGQFGQFPLYAFCTDGIWALELTDEGTYKAKQPVNRDVCSNPKSITQLDNAVLYATDRGLKVIQGSETRLLTAQLEAATESLDILPTPPSGSGLINPSTLSQQSLLQILQTARISYDGINNIAHIFPTTPTTPSHFLLHLDTMEWTRATGDLPVTFVDGYPNATLQINEEVTTGEPPVTSTVAKLYQYQQASNSSENTLQGLILTRETAFGNPTAYKMLHDLRVIRRAYASNAKVRIQPLVSNDRLHWHILRSLKSHSWKWYRFAVYTLLTDADTLEGITVLTAQRRTDKLR